MPGRFGRLSRSLTLGAGVATTRFPVAVILIALIALVSNLAVQDLYFPNQADFPWFVAALYGAAASAVVARVAAESREMSALIQIAAPVSVAVVVGLLIWAGPALSVFAPALIVAATFAVPLAPYVGRGDDGRFWAFTLWTFVGVALAFLSVLLFTLGLSAILEMIRFLFEIGLPGNAYEHIFVTAFTLVGPLFALGRVPRDFDDSAPFLSDDRLVAGVRILFDWVAAPLALVTSVVLHLYAAKILLTFELPKNEIGWIVTFFALLVLSVRVAADPFIEGGALPTRLFARVWALMLVVPLALLALAATLRIGSEGFTIERYYLALGGLAAGLVVAAQVLPRLRGDIRIISGIPVLLLALSALGPWGAPDTVGRSQADRIRNAFADEDGIIRIADQLTDAERSVLRSRIYALDEAGQIGRIASQLDEETAERLAASLVERPSDAVSVLLAGLGLSAVELSRSFVAMSAGGNAPLDLSGYDAGLVERFVEADIIGEAAGGAQATAPGLTLSGSDLVVTLNGTTDSFPLGFAIADLPPSIFSASDPAALDPPVFELASEAGRNVRISLRQVAFDPESEAIASATLTLLFREDEWPAAAPPGAAGDAASPASLGGGGDAGATEPSGAVGQRPR